MISSFCLQQEEMTTITVLTKETLKQKVSPKEIEEQDTCMEKEIKELSSPFSNFLKNLFSGGGRDRKERVKKGEIDVIQDPTIKEGNFCGQDFKALRQSKTLLIVFHAHWSQRISAL